MSKNRNAERLGMADPASSVQTSQQNEEPSMSGAFPAPSPAGLDFTVQTEFVQLPSKGKYYSEEHPLHGVDEVEIKLMTADEENILANKSLIKKGVVIDRLLQSILVDKSINVNDLLLGDKNAIIVEARIGGYGSEYRTDVICPKCGTKYKNNFDLETAKKINHGRFEEIGVELTSQNTFLIPLLKMKNVVVECKMLTGHDETALVFKQKAMKKKGIATKPVTEQLEAFIVSVNGDTNKSTISKLVKVLPVKDSTLLRKIYKEVVPNISLLSDIECPECDHTEEVVVPFGAEFFWLK